MRKGRHEVPVAPFSAFEAKEEDLVPVKEKLLDLISLDPERPVLVNRREALYLHGWEKLEGEKLKGEKL